MTHRIAVRYLHGKVHATPWAASHNEGRVEFPPAPWRLMRALVCTAFERCPAIELSVVQSLMKALAASPPSFIVPPFSLTHVRHWMPDPEHKPIVKHATSRVLDGFAAVDPATTLIVEWEVDLTETQRNTLAILCAELPYLGRAESVVEARLLADDEPAPVEPGSRRVAAGQLDDVDNDAGRLLVARDPLDWSGLIQIPWKLRQKGYVIPPAALELQYVADAPLVWESRRRAVAARRDDVEYIEWSVAGRGPIPATAAVAFTDVLRTQVIRQFERRGTPPSEVTGKSEDGSFLRDQHRHAHFLPVLEGARLSGLAVWFPAGVPSEIADVVASVDNLRWVGDRTPGSPTARTRKDSERDDDDVPTETSTPGQRDFRGVRLFLQRAGRGSQVIAAGPSTSWRTITPYSPTRHQGRRTFESFVFDDVARELGHRGLPAPIAVRERTSERGSALRFRRHRLKERLNDGRGAFHLEIEFEQPVTGPIAIGALSHYGLGLFEPHSG